MADPASNNCDEQQAANEAADRLLDRVVEDVARGLKEENDPVEALGDIAEEVETSPEAIQVRRAAGHKTA